MVDGFIIQYMDKELKDHFFDIYQKLVNNKKIWDNNISITSINIPGDDVKIELLLEDPESNKVYKGKVQLKKKWLYDAEQGQLLDKHAKIPYSTKPAAKVELRIMYALFLLYKKFKDGSINKMVPDVNTIHLILVDKDCTMLVYADKE